MALIGGHQPVLKSVGVELGEIDRGIKGAAQGLAQPGGRGFRPGHQSAFGQHNLMVAGEGERKLCPCAHALTC